MESPRIALAHRTPTAATVSADADRRHVTVLFADVSGFTTLSERLDPEEIRAFQNALFAKLAEAVARYDGFVEKFVGDAVMAVFGAPLVHEDDPERALRAALDMVEGSKALSQQWAARLGQPVKLHIGVHSGPVVAGSLGNAAGAAYAVTGDTVNTTARLLAAASGTVLVSAATHALTRHLFDFEPARELTLRGKSEPVMVHRLVGVLADPRPARGLASHGMTSPMIGRADERVQLLSAFDRMQRDRAQLVSVMGEAGTGKSRLIAEFVTQLEVDGRLAHTAVRRAACSSMGEPTYGVFSALFREAYQVDTTNSLDVARQKLAAGLEAMGARPEVAETITPVLSYMLGVEDLHRHDFEPELLKRQIGLAARALVDRRLQEMPLLYIVEDIHWADTASVDLLRDLVDHFADRRLMVVLSHRTETRPPHAASAAQSLIRLAALTDGETRAVVSGLFGNEQGDALNELQELVISRAGGNPLFVEEIVRTLLAKGYLALRDGRWECTTVRGGVDVPPTLQGLLLSRVDRLPAGARRLLQEAAVLGTEFEENFLRAIATDAAADLTALDSLVGADLLRPVHHGREAGRYRFTHALVHETVYQNLLISRRSELHERVGCALESIAGSQPERLSDLEALGHHWSLSSNKAKGAKYLVAAGDWARSVYANADAIRHYERALTALDNGKACSVEVGPVRERLGDVLALTGRRADALAHYEAARAVMESTGDRARVARLYRKIGGLHWEAGDRPRASACFAPVLML